jgi:ABC-2 type transport system permease protein
MRNILNVIKNDFRRTASHSSYVFISLGITFSLILLAVFFTSRFEIKGNIALISSGGTPKIESEHLNITLLDDPPPVSRLVMNRYDAVVTDEGGGKFRIESIKSEDFKEMLKGLLQNPGAYNIRGHENRGPGVNILGYLIMFLLLQGLFFMAYFTEDKERRNLRRILASPVAMGSYLAGHFIFNLIMMFLPTMAVLAAGKELLKVDIGLSYAQYSFLLAILCIFSSAFALLMTAAVEKGDNVMAFASAVVVLTSILSGSFSAINTGSAAVNRLFGLFPQKSFLELAQGLENSRPVADFLPQLGFLLLLSALMAGLGAAICRKRFNEGRY